MLHCDNEKRIGAGPWARFARLSSVNGWASLDAKSRAPGPVIVLSITEINDPLVSPERVENNSRFRRVAASISNTDLFEI